MDNSAALYQRHRPRRLDALVGQATAATRLRTSLENGTVRHAYLFVGPRGTGKTSSARILAMALNCLDPDGVEPCGVCMSCASIINGTSLDVEERDAASNSGVDQIRKIIKDAALTSPGKRKVIILDEAHRLSGPAADALLKILEEPPGKLVFILATTDPKSLKDTIPSRAIEIPFKLVPAPAMREHLSAISASDNLGATPEMIEEAVRLGGGSVRDTLSRFEAVLASGVSDDVRSSALLQAIASGEIIEVFKVVAASVQEGTAPRTLAEDTLAQLRDLFLIQMGAADLVLSPDSDARTELARVLGARRTVQAMDALGEAITAMRGDHDARVNLEVSLARYCKSAN